MTKLKNIKMYATEDVPDHIIEEINRLGETMLKALEPILINKPGNIVIACYTTIYASLLVNLISDEALEEAAQNAAISIMKNIEFIAKKKGIDTTEWFQNKNG
jgi:hypothetical protein